MQHTITLYRTPSGWMSRTTDPQVRELFGTDVLPTAFTAQAEAVLPEGATNMRTVKSKTVHVSLYGMTGRGQTKEEARADAQAKLEAATEGYYTPAVVHWRHLVAFVYRDLHGWNYTVFDGPREHDRYCDIRTGTDKQEAIGACRRHLAQWGWTHADGVNVPAVLEGDECGQREHLAWVRWQLGYKAHKDAHPEATDTECRNAASAVQCSR